jgi:acyl-CoA synthetase (AMP-forming)/AMP-acid ligase II
MAAALLAAWARTVRAAPAAVAVQDASTGRSWTRAELAAAAEAWAGQHGANARGRRVFFAEPNGPNWFVLLLGLLRAGATAAPLDPGEPPAAQRELARAAGGAFLWSAGALEPVGPGRRSRAAGRVIKLTSGSTGRPRALSFTGRQLLADGRQICATMRIRPGDLNVGLIPFGHSYGLGNLVVPLLAQGTAVLCGVPALPQALAAAIARYRPTVFPAVPAILRALAESEIPPGRLRSLRLVITAGAPLSPEVAPRFAARFGRRIHNFYGSSETGGIAYDRSGAATLAGRSVGLPLAGVRLAFGRGARFTVASPAVLGGRHRPADCGNLNSRGELVLLGRTGRMLKVAGRRLDPAEVERALRLVAGVREAWVAAHPLRPDALAAVIATEIGGADVTGALRARLAAWKIPKKIVIVPKFPVTARGKPDLRRLAAHLAESTAGL